MSSESSSENSSGDNNNNVAKVSERNIPSSEFTGRSKNQKPKEYDDQQVPKLCKWGENCNRKDTGCRFVHVGQPQQNQVQGNRRNDFGPSQRNGALIERTVCTDNFNGQKCVVPGCPYYHDTGIQRTPARNDSGRDARNDARNYDRPRQQTNNPRPQGNYYPNYHQ